MQVNNASKPKSGDLTHIFKKKCVMPENSSTERRRRQEEKVMCVLMCKKTAFQTNGARY